MDKNPAILAIISLLVSGGLQMSGYVNIYAAYVCWLISLILTLNAIRGWWIHKIRQPKDQQHINSIAPSKKNDERLMSLSEAVEKLRQEGLKQTTSGGNSLDSILKMQNTDDEFDRLARLLADQVDIYGKTASSTFDDWVIINEDYFNIGDFKRRASELHLRNYYERGPEFTNLAIKKDYLAKAIEKILSSNTIYQG